MICNKNLFIGFIKVGYKHLFIYDEIGVPMEINPLCVLDFYTYETCQRKGFGKIMFTEMLQNEKIEPRKLGYDRPSPKFINFLNKYYGLKNYVPQNNNFVVFTDYFIDEPRKKDKYDIYSNSFKNYSNNYNNDRLTQRKVDKKNYYNYSNENKAYNNFKKNINYYNDNNDDGKDFCTKIYNEYSNFNNNYNNNENQEIEKKEKEIFDEKKYINYHYRPSSSEYEAFFHNK